MKFSGQLVIEGYLNGKTFDQISKDNQVSKGTVFNIIKEWKDRVSIPDVESIRDFSTLVRKSGITLEQYVQGFRFINILSNFGISDQADANYHLNSDIDHDVKYTPRLDENAQITDNKNGRKNRSRTAITSRDNFYYFIGKLYNNCKTHRIDPSIIIRWIDDLLEFGASDSNPYESNNSVDDTSSDGTNDLRINSGLKVTRDHIPFISNIDGYMEQKRIENQKLQEVKFVLSRDIKRANKQKETAVLNLKEATTRERTIMMYYSWYEILKEELHSKYDIGLDEEFGLFAKAIDDFRGYDYNVLKIINDHKQIESLNLEKEKLQSVIDLKTPLKDSLLNQIDILQENLSYSKQTMNTYEELLKRGLGLKELKQLLNTLMEISLANKLSVVEALPRFLNDIENQYDIKLGFESTIDNLKMEKEKLKTEVPEYKMYLQLQGIVSPLIVQLNNSGVTNEDIIKINELVLSFKNSNFLDDTSFKVDGNSMLKNGVVSNNEFWKRFIQKLRNLRNIHVAIDQSMSISNNLKIEIEGLKIQKQELEKNYSNSVLNLNQVTTQASFSIEIMRQIHQEINKGLQISARLNPVMLYLLIVKNNDEENDKEKTTILNKCHLPN